MGYLKRKKTLSRKNDLRHLSIRFKLPVHNYLINVLIEYQKAWKVNLIEKNVYCHKITEILFAYTMYIFKII